MNADDEEKAGEPPIAPVLQPRTKDKAKKEESGNEPAHKKRKR